MNLPFFIARRYLVKQKGTFSSFIIRLAIVATALSVAVMIVSVAFITGFKYRVKEELFSFLGHVHVAIYNNNPIKDVTLSSFKEDPKMVSYIRQIPHVVQVAPYAERPVIIHSKSEMEGLELKGITRDFRFLKGISFTGNKIDYSDTSYSKQILLSEAIANKLDVSIGDTLELCFLEQGEAYPRIRKVKLAGLFHTGAEEVDKEFALCDLRLLQRINQWQPNEINGYQVDLDDPEYSDTVSNQIFYQYLKPRIMSQLTTYTIRDIFPNVFDWLQMTNVDAKIILIIMAIVAIINLAAVLMILIVEQARMIGLLKALGMAINNMRRLFLYYSGLIAMIGVIAGNIIALSICWLQLKTGFLQLSEDTYYMKYAPVRLYWWQIASIDAATLLVCVLCMWLPTLYIRRIRPARVLQFK
ncbi:MAG TPA: FtsX-like permease family protein [Flavipsychrobacter sp.]|nr:FtsX-like permease family protein [Flavipsychrobacter sp.]